MQNARIDVSGNDYPFPQPIVAEAATSVEASDFDDMIGDDNAPFIQPIVAEAACDFEPEDPFAPQRLDECEEGEEPFIVPGNGG